MDFPYMYISCPCTDVSLPVNGSIGSQNDEEQDRTFDPRSPRAKFSLYTLEHLLYCEDCQQIKCPRCIIEEIVYWYCPNCLFEMPPSLVKSEGGRCSRSCFNCPICAAPLAVNSMYPDPNLKAVHGPWILSCGYCNWTSLDIGWQFEKLGGMGHQMANLQIGEQPKSANTESPDLAKSRTLDSSSEFVASSTSVTNLDPNTIFSSIRSFYSSQLSSSNPSDPLLTPSGGYNYSSPNSLARIMSLYTGRSFGKKNQGKSSLMRESADISEGLKVLDETSDAEIIRKMRNSGWTATASISQQAEQRHTTKFSDGLRPNQTLLRTKRSKRCQACRHILVKPEPKVQSTRFRIRLIALNYIPTISLKPLQSSPSTQLPPIDLNALQPFRASQFLLTLKNPLFDLVKVTLATPTTTPGTHGHKVTILCPQFDIGPNVDQWDEALGDGKSRRSSKLVSASKVESAGGERVGRVAEAGKVWGKGRNWTTVVVEVVCAPVDAREDIEEDDSDVLEIPVFVRMEWVADLEREDGDGGMGGDEKKDKRELAYWSVIGVGRVEKSEGPS